MSQNSPQFKKLKAVWDKKLAKSGFNDIEQEDENLKTWTTGILKKRTSIEAYKAKETYFQLAGQFLYSHKFDSKEDMLIWKYHSDGLSSREIVKELKKSNKIKIYRMYVSQLIIKLRNQMLSEIGQDDVVPQ